jgi:hypothetical protein
MDCRSKGRRQPISSNRGKPRVSLLLRKEKSHERATRPLRRPILLRSLRRKPQAGRRKIPLTASRLGGPFKPGVGLSGAAPRAGSASLLPSSTAIKKQMNLPFDLLIGRRTFDIWARFWPQHNGVWPAVNTATKCRLEYPDFSRMAAVGISKRGHCGKNRQNQATGRAGFARVWKRKSRSDAPQA